MFKDRYAKKLSLLCCSRNPVFRDQNLKTMLAVDDVLIDDGIRGAMFCCDLAGCRGACCVEGELGAPVMKEEVEALEAHTGNAMMKLPERSRRFIGRNGIVEEYQGELYTRTIDDRECVFALRKNGVALCAIESRKPLSCRLFPVRIRKKFGMDYLVYEQHTMCREARKKGKEKMVFLVDYVAESLIEKYGATWFSRLQDLLSDSSLDHA